MNRKMRIPLIGISIGLILLIVILMFGIPTYRVWQQEMSGKAEMAKAEQNRKILIEEARARLEAEKLNAQAEVERAKGITEDMRIEKGKHNSNYNQTITI